MYLTQYVIMYVCPHVCTYLSTYIDLMNLARVCTELEWHIDVCFDLLHPYINFSYV